MRLLLAITLFEGVDVTSFDGVKKLLENAAIILMGFVGALSVVFIIVGGIQYITSAGNSDGSAKAKKTITYAVGGLILALSTTAIINLINTLFF
ncbi:MAG: hypothetical protein QG675_77 [Patescibacteria group bacterium]|jgi:hypothetical protein|nr:hypothetical protein [Patescibacteria group bacterium]